MPENAGHHARPDNIDDRQGRPQQAQHYSDKLLSRWGLGARQSDGQLEHLVTILALQVHLDRFGVDVDILLDHFEQFTTQKGQIVRTPSSTSFLRDNDPQPFLGDTGCRGATAKKCK